MGDCVPKVDIFAKSHVMLLFMDAAYLSYKQPLYFGIPGVCPLLFTGIFVA